MVTVLNQFRCATHGFQGRAYAAVAWHLLTEEPSRCPAARTRVAFYDVDEFLVLSDASPRPSPSSREESSATTPLRRVLDRYPQAADVWRLADIAYGSSNWIRRPQFGGVTANFVLREDEDGCGSGG